MDNLAYVPDQVCSMAEFPEEAATPSPACLPVQTHEAGVLLAEVAGPEAVHNAAAGGKRSQLGFQGSELLTYACIPTLIFAKHSHASPHRDIELKGFCANPCKICQLSKTILRSLTTLVSTANEPVALFFDFL